MGPNMQIGTKSLRALTNPVISPRRTGRLTGAAIDNGLALGQTLAPPDPTGSWRTLKAMRSNLLDLPYSHLAQIALDLSPQVNKGMWDFLRFCNPGVILKEANENQVAIDSTNAFIRRMNAYYGSFKSHIDSMWTGIFITGGLFIELILAEGARYPIDIAINNPISARFRKEPHPIRGSRWRLGQETLTGFRYMDDDPLIKYLGFDRLSDNPYGRPIIGPAVHASLTLLSLIEILQKVLANQGLSRIDYEIQAEELLNLIDRNQDIAGDDEATAQFITDQIEKVKQVVNSLDPDQDYVHLSTVKVNYAANPTTSGNAFGLDSITDKLQRDVVNGIKSVTSLNNFLDSTTETHIRSQLEYYVAGIQSLQDEVSDVLSMFFTIGNQVQGIQSEMEYLFRKQRTADRKASAEIKQLETDTIIKKLDAGIIDENEARDETSALTDELQVAF